MESIGPLMETALQELGLRRASSGGTGFGLDIRRLRTWVRRRTRFINLRFKIGRFLNQDGSKPRVCGFLGKLEKRRHLTHRNNPYSTRCSPRYAPYRPAQNADVWNLVPAKCTKVNFGNSWFQTPSGAV